MRGSVFKRTELRNQRSKFWRVAVSWGSRSAERRPAEDDVARQRKHASLTNLNCVLWRVQPGFKEQVIELHKNKQIQPCLGIFERKTQQLRAKSLDSYLRI